MKTITIIPGDNGPDFDLFSYLENELNARGIEATITGAGVDPPPRAANVSRSNCPDARSALEQFISTIEATGGVIQSAEGWCAPIGDPEWIDLGEAYLAACAELGREPVTRDAEEDDLL